MTPVTKPAAPSAEYRLRDCVPIASFDPLWTFATLLACRSCLLQAVTGSRFSSRRRTFVDGVD